MKKQNEELKQDDIDINNIDILEDDILIIDDKVDDEIEVDDDVIIDEPSTDSENVSYTKNAKLVGKHSLKHDKIFVGGKARKHVYDDDDEQFAEDVSKEAPDGVNDKVSFEIDYESSVLGTYLETEDYLRIKKLKERVLEAVINNTNINIDSPRRKPSEKDFNKYYRQVKKYLKNDNFSDAEIFVQLSEYFSDNLYGMFKLLEASYAAKILSELQNKYNFKEINNISFF